MSGVESLRVVVLQTESDLWCDICAALSATRVIYAVEEGDRPAGALRRLTYCDSCGMSEGST